MKFRAFFVGSALLIALLSGGTFLSAAGERLEVHVHKNTLDGDEWSSAAAPILLQITADGSGVGIGEGLNSQIDARKGPLALQKEEVCQFSWNDASGNTVTKEVKLKRYHQRPAGEFVVPPLRISEPRLLLESTPLQNCGGGETEYQALSQEMATFPENPFQVYREYISLPVENFLNQEVVIAIPSTDAGSGGYNCRQEDAEGLCRQTLRLDPLLASAGVFRSDLVVFPTTTGPGDEAAVEEALVQGVNAEFSGAVTFVGNLLMRTSALLDWTLAIDETGLRNEKITVIYQKSLNIVNGFFILALLAIALLWNFSLLISRERLKKMVVLFIIGIISVNFALPLTRLAVDGTNLLQRTLLVKETDSTAPQITSGTSEDAAQRAAPEVQRISAGDILSSSDLDFGAFLGLQKSAYVEKNYPQNLGAPINTDQLSNRADLYVDRFTENTWFSLALIGLGALGQLLIALILLFRYIIIWFLLIFSPFLLLLMLFESTRPLLRSWSWLYVRWLLIGPILAMALFVVVNIWSLSGIPLESSYAAPSGLVFPNTTNLYVAAPGVTSGYLNTPREIMKYIGALMMLYMAVLLPFWLTRALPGGISSLSTAAVRRKNGFLTKIFGHSGSETSANTERQEGAGKSVEVHDAPAGVAAMRENTTANLEAGGRKSPEVNTDLSTISSRNLVNTLQILDIGPKGLSRQDMQKKRKEVWTELAARAQGGDAIARERIEQERTAQKVTSTIEKVDMTAKGSAQEMKSGGPSAGIAGEKSDNSSPAVAGSSNSFDLKKESFELPTLVESPGKNTPASSEEASELQKLISKDPTVGDDLPLEPDQNRIDRKLKKDRP